MRKEEIKNFITLFNYIIKEMPGADGLTDSQCSEAILDGLFEAFKNAEIHRSDLAIAADMLGYEMTDEFMNDPQPDPIDLK